MNSISIDGHTLNNISRMYTMYMRTNGTEFEFRFGSYTGNRFVPGVSAAQHARLIDHMQKTVKGVSAYSTVTLYPDGFRAIETDRGIVLQKKTSLGPPITVDSVGRFSIATETPVARLPKGLEPTGKRVRDRISFAVKGYTVDATRVGEDAYEVEIEFGSNMHIRDIFGVIKNVRGALGAATDSPRSYPVSRDVSSAFRKMWNRGRVKFNNAVNMKRRHFAGLGEFVITPKWDGTRMALFVHGTESSLFNLTTSFRAPFTFDSGLDGTIFDGEFFEDTGKFIAYDILYLSGKDTRNLPRIERTLMLEQTHALYGLTFDMAEVGYGFSLHECFVNYTTKYPEHMLDGVVFAPRTSAYYNTNTLKYKPIELLTIDFLIRIDRSGRYVKYLLFVQGPDRRPIPFEPYPVIQKVDAAGRELIGDGTRIIECKWERDTFVPHRVRDDKTIPNFVTIALDIWEDLNDPITESEMGAVLRDISGTFSRLNAFEGRHTTVGGDDSLVVSSAGVENTSAQSIAYALNARYQLMSHREQAEVSDKMKGALSSVSDSEGVNIYVVDMYSGNLVFSVVNHADSIILAYVIGPIFYPVGRFVACSEICSSIDRVFGAERAQLPDMNGSDVETVIRHYDIIPAVPRSESSVISLRKYNNWVKSMLISLSVGRGDVVLDLGSGKGGDLRKWCHAKIKWLTSVDISEKSLQHAEERFLKMRGCRMGAEWIHANPYADLLSINRKYNLVSSQFSFHYAFATPENAETAVRNVASSLVPNGLFIATIPNAERLVELASERGSTFGNSVYTVEFDPDTDLDANTGARYTFTLTGSVDAVPEYLVHIPYLSSLFESHGMVLEFAVPFPKFVETYGKRFETVSKRIGVTQLSEDESEAAGLYMTVMYRKV